ncbi:MAG: PEP-CTERM sorting domain-containing protein [Candidatus Polarisedimenticolaceae bacterium]|nr:PEP-CTERM sorting domain-containing protein [Candidatus Polarisedimenticolaceae bacterium]
MKKFISLFAGAVMLLSIATMSSAAIITDTVSQYEYVNWLGSYSYTHNLNDDGFVLGSATSGTLSIDIADDDEGRYDFYEVIVFTVEEFDFDTGGWTFGTAFTGDLEINALAALNTDGYLDVTVSSLMGDFYVGDSVLEVDTIPEPSTVLLLSVGLLGLAACRKATA